VDRDAFVLLAVIRRARGLRGEVVVGLEGSGPDRFIPGLKVWLWPADANRAPRQAEVEQAWLHGGEVVLKFRSTDDRTAAEELHGFEIRIPETERPPAGEGEYYLSDLIGCRVLTTAGQEVGEVRAWLDFGASPLLEVRGSGGAEHLLPWVKGMYTAVDLESRRIVMDLPEGLLELPRSKV
jgi:16S rRNA processing protein RimM